MVGRVDIMANGSVNNRHQVFAALAVMDEGGEFGNLLNHLSGDDVKLCREATRSYLEIAAGERKEKIKEHISQMFASEQWSGLAEIHPAWLLEELVKESPRVIGIILRYLPSRHVRYIIEHLPPTVRYAIPNVVEAFSVAEAVLDIIRRVFESKFIQLRLSKAVGQFGFDHLYYLRGEELEVFFRDLGVQELAMALDGISGESLNYLLNRLTLKDAKKLQKRIKELSDVSRALKRQARFTVLEVEGTHLGPEHLLLEIGLAAFARAVSTSNKDLSRLIGIKLDPHISYVLKRYVSEKADKSTKDVMKERQSIILSCVVSLAAEKLIDESWSCFFQGDSHKDV